MASDFSCKNCGNGAKNKIKKEQQFCCHSCSVEYRKKKPTSPDEGEAAVFVHDLVKTNGKLKMQLDRSKLENKLLRRDISSGSAIAEVLKESIQTLPRIRVITPPQFRFSKTTKEEEAVLLFSDLHAAEVIRSPEVDGFNEYNFEVFCCRLKKLQESIVDIVTIQRKGGITIDKLNVFSLGDLVSGDIHQELKVTNEMPIITAALQTALVVAQFLIKLSMVFKEIEFTGVIGNHDRKGPEKEFKEKYDSIGWLIYQTIAILTSEYPDIRYKIPFSPFTIHQVYDWKYLLVHGDGKTQYAGGLPYSGIARMSTDFQSIYRDRGGFDLMVAGHYHDAAQIPNSILNGAFVGGSEYSIGNVRRLSRPLQKFFGVSKNYLHTFMYDVFLDKAPSSHDYIYNRDAMLVELMRKFEKKLK